MYGFFISYGFIFELMLSFALFTWFLKKRRFFLLRLLGLTGVLFLYGFFRSLIPAVNAWTESLKYAVLYVLCFCGLLGLFSAPPRAVLYCTIGASLTQHCAYRTGDLVRSCFGGLVTAGDIAYVAAVLFVNAIVWILVARPMSKDDQLDALPSGPILLLSGSMLLVCVLFQQLFDQYAARVEFSLYVIFACFDIVAGVFALGIQYAVYSAWRLHRDYSMLEHVLQLQKEQMKQSKETIDLINVKCHDLKKQIALLGDRNRITQEEIGELNRAITIYDASVKTGNEALDVLLAEKVPVCESKGIQINCIADGYKLDFMRSSDIYSLFGNAIDNAVEAVSKIEDPSRRCIGIHIREDRGMISAHFENYYTGALDFDAGLPRTTKSDKRWHGFGMKSIKMIAEKYGGWVSVQADDKVFNLNILLPIPAKKRSEKFSR